MRCIIYNTNTTPNAIVNSSNIEVPIILLKSDLSVKVPTITTYKNAKR